MPKQSANQILARNLNLYISRSGISNLALGRKAKIAANTIANYRKTDPLVTSTGKERSAKLAEVERLAGALGVSVVDLLSDGEPVTANAPSTLPRELHTMLEDLDDLPPARQSQIIDNIHQLAEEARAAAAHLASRNRVPAASASTGGSSRRSITIKHGDGNPDQKSLTLVTVDDPWRAVPGESEQELYRRISASKPPSGE